MRGGRKKGGGGGQGPKAPAPSPTPPPYGGLGGEWEGRAGGLRSPGPSLTTPKPRLRICVPVTEVAVSRARSLYLRAVRKKLWAEIRLDYLAQPDLKRLFRTLPGPVVATNRARTEGGKWAGTEAERRRLLEESLAFGVHYLDVELSTEASWRQELLSRRGQTRVILSWHDFSGTPEAPELESRLEEMLSQEAEVVKLVTLARKPEDNLRVLSLIPRARAAGREIIAFCMGPLGQWSRLAAPFLGSFLTFAPFNPKQASAPGQLTVNEVRRLWGILK